MKGDLGYGDVNDLHRTAHQYVIPRSTALVIDLKLSDRMEREPAICAEHPAGKSNYLEYSTSRVHHAAHPDPCSRVPVQGYRYQHSLSHSPIPLREGLDCGLNSNGVLGKWGIDSYMYLVRLRASSVAHSAIPECWKALSSMYVTGFYADSRPEVQRAPIYLY